MCSARDRARPGRAVIELDPIATVVGGRVDPVDDDWAVEECVIRLDGSRFGPEVLDGLDDFSHVEVVFHFHLVEPDGVTLGSRRPRGRADWPSVGIFAQRARSRPNRLGVSVCELVAVRGLDVVVRGLDAVDGSPVLDLKPYMSGFAPRGAVREPPWAVELMAHYWSP